MSRRLKRSALASRLPLSALLSQVLIAFTIELDREVNLTRTTASVGTTAPSLAMWSNVLRFVGEQGVDKRRLPALSGVSKSVIHTMVACLERHGWVVVEPGPSDNRAKIIRLTARSRKLRKVWQPLLADVEMHWEKRFGKDEIEKLRESLEAVVGQLDNELPHYPMAMPNRGGTPTGL